MKLLIALIALAIVIAFVWESTTYAHQCSQKRKGRAPQ